MYNIDLPFCKALLKELGILINSDDRITAAQIAIDNLAVESQEHIDMYRMRLVEEMSYNAIGAKFGKNAKHVEMVCRYKNKQFNAKQCLEFIKSGVHENEVVNDYYAAEACLTVDFPIRTKLGTKDTIDDNPIGVLELPIGIQFNLTRAGFKTINELKSHIYNLGPVWYQGIKRIGYPEASIVESSMCITWPKRIGAAEGDYREDDAMDI